MLSLFQRARVIDTGDYEIPNVATGTIDRYPWIEVIQRRDERPDGYPEIDSTGVLRLSLDRELMRTLDGPALQFGDVVDGVIQIAEETKVIKGTDRSVDRAKLKVVALKVVHRAAAPQAPVAAAK